MGPSLRRTWQRCAQSMRAPVGPRLRRERMAGLVVAFAAMLAAGFGATLLVGGARTADAAGSGWPFFKADLHVHSVVSGDGDADLGIIADSGKKAGYNIFFITDHGRGSTFPISGQQANLLTLTDTDNSQPNGIPNRWSPVTVGTPGATVTKMIDTVDRSGVLQVQSSGAGFASVTSRRGPNLRSGNSVLTVSINPTSTGTGGGLFLSASIGGDPTVAGAGGPAGYTTAAGVVSPGKSYVFIWYYKNPPPAAFYGSANVKTFQLGAAGSGSTCTPALANGTWSDCTITLNTALNSVPPADQPDNINAFLDLQMGATGVAQGLFDNYSLSATASVLPGPEFAYRNSLLPQFDTPTFQMYPSVEIGVGNHTQRFNFATPDDSQSDQLGTDAIATTQATGYLAQLNHPGVAGGVSDQGAIDNNAYGADQMEVRMQNMINDWDAILSKGVTLIGTWGTDNHIGTWSGASEADYIQAPTIGFNDVMRSMFEGRLYLGLQSFGGKVIFNPDPASTDVYPARYPVFVSPAQTTAPLHLNISSGIVTSNGAPPPLQVVWITNNGVQLAVDPINGFPFDVTRQIPIGAGMTYVRAEVQRVADGSQVAMTEPIIWTDVPNLPNGVSIHVDGVTTPDGTGYTRNLTKGITGVSYAGGAMTVNLDNPAGSLVELAGATGGSGVARVTVGGASVPRASSAADYQASQRAWLVDGGTLRIKVTQAAGPTAVVVAFAGGADTTPPAVPTGLTASPGSGGVTLGWDPSSDNVAVAGYTVYRDGLALGEATTNRFTDATAAPGGSYRYTVDAFDAARNQSAQSAPAIVGTLPPQQTVTTTTNPPPSTTTTVGPPPKPPAAIAGAFRSANGQPHDETFDLRAAFTPGKVPSALARRAPKHASARLKGKVLVEQGRRALFTSARLAGIRRPVTMVAYDGATYVSRDGKTFHRAASPLLDLMPWLPPAGLGQALTAVPKSLTGIKSLGAARLAGVSTRRYQAKLTIAGLRRYVAAALTRMGKTPALARAAAATAKAKVNRVDVYVGAAGGELDRLVVTVSASVNAGRLVKGLKNTIPGTVTATTTVNASDYGASLFVGKPLARGTVSTLRALARS